MVASAGGVREGILFTYMTPTIRAQYPMLVAAWRHVVPASDGVAYLLTTCMHLEAWWPERLDPCHLVAVAGLAYHFDSVPKEAQAASALRCTTTGILAGAHGLSHDDRAVVALMLYERYGGEVGQADQVFVRKLQTLVGPKLTWWCQFFGRVAQLIVYVYPCDKLPVADRMKLSCRQSQYLDGPLGHEAPVVGITVEVTLLDSLMTTAKGLTERTEAIRKLGKRKNWIEGYGKKVQIMVYRQEELTPPATSPGGRVADSMSPRGLGPVESLSASTMEDSSSEPGATRASRASRQGPVQARIGISDVDFAASLASLSTGV